MVRFVRIVEPEEITRPEIRSWQLCFDAADGTKNRDRVVREFYEFISDPRIKEVTLPGYTMMRGIVYGNPKFPDGEEILTSYVVKISKEEPGYSMYDRIDEDARILCIKTQNNKYLVDIDEQHVLQFLMMTDWQFSGKLDNNKGAYLPEKYQDSFLL